MPKHEQPCWKCTKFLDGCSWSRAFIPVEGWEAKFSPHTKNNSKADSYFIKYCPEFELEKYDCNECKFSHIKNAQSCNTCCFNPKCENPQSAKPWWEMDIFGREES